jgi:hypothetical protein
MAFDFDKELLIAIARYEERFGDRDKRFQLLPVHFHSLPYAQSLVDEINLTVAVRLVVRGNL